MSGCDSKTTKPSDAEIQALADRFNDSRGLRRGIRLFGLGLAWLIAQCIYYWRFARGRCVLCGTRIVQGTSGMYYTLPNPRACRVCNKQAMHAANYGAGPGRTLELYGKVANNQRVAE